MLFLQVPIPTKRKGHILDETLTESKEIPHTPVAVRDYYSGTTMTDIETNVSSNSTFSVNTFVASDSPCSINSPWLGERSQLKCRLFAKNVTQQ